MAGGRTNAAIAATLYLSERAVEKHINAIFRKLGLSEELDINRRVAAVLSSCSETSTDLVSGLGLVAAGASAPVRSGKVATTVVPLPGVDVMSSRPPNDLARSSMWRRPPRRMPSPARKPRPSSLTVTCSHSPSTARLISILDASACFRALVTASPMRK